MWGHLTQDTTGQKVISYRGYASDNASKRDADNIYGGGFLKAIGSSGTTVRVSMSNQSAEISNMRNIPHICQLMCHRDDSTSPQDKHNNESEGGFSGSAKLFTSLGSIDEASANVILGFSALNVVGTCNKMNHGPLLSRLLQWREHKDEKVEGALSQFYQEDTIFIYGLPTNYDVLCDPSDSYSNHIYNCRFRTMAAMWASIL
jgi:hypothetical protein